MANKPADKEVKQTTMAQEAAQTAAAERPYIATEQDWDAVSTPEFGGQADILQVQVGEIAGPFEYMGHQPMIMEGGKTVTVHLGVDKSGDTLRLPIAASFLRAVDQAELMRGDTFLLRRSEDVKKKAGIGKGQAMQIYAVKVKTRVPRQAVTETKPF
jgi:hypothetical protein